jgi:LysM repeat protein
MLSILHALRKRGIVLRLKTVIDANPGLNPLRLLIGQRIFIRQTKPPMEPAPPEEAAVRAEAAYYMVRKGDSIASIADAHARSGLNVTAFDILEANPGLQAAKLLIGQKILVPSAKPNRHKE